MAKVKEVKEGIAIFDVIDGYVLENEEKLRRVIEGEPARSGQSTGGLLEKYVELELIPPAEVLAHYDKLGGYITKGIGGEQRVKVKNGAFWDSRKKIPREKPEIMYIFRVGGNFIEVDDPAKLAQAISKVENAVAENQAKNAAKKARAKAKRLTK